MMFGRAEGCAEAPLFCAASAPAGAAAAATTAATEFFKNDRRPSIFRAIFEPTPPGNLDEPRKRSLCTRLCQRPAERVERVHDSESILRKPLGLNRALC